MKAKLSNEERRKSYYMKLWGLDEKISYREPHRFIKQLAPEHYHAPKFVKLNNWNWRENFGSLEEATEFLLNYCQELGPLAEELLRRSGKDMEIIHQLTIINHKLKRGITNDKGYRKRSF